MLCVQTFFGARIAHFIVCPSFGNYMKPTSSKVRLAILAVTASASICAQASPSPESSAPLARKAEAISAESFLRELASIKKSGSFKVDAAAAATRAKAVEPLKVALDWPIIIGLLL